ncbi:hypothetical protein O7622_05595 [Micromonospora sp. WMMD1076]|uniref:hypothetical protein n=1 Tax=Micromonospora sp. WMMD1076 TaxID=3016103 RepID=UPI00249A4027|nr:hypothetical protein [Micromonospora sp. WMMD1076]WFF10164.1 hypothetical protein O7622_05595 [Micromonospora sp. WMMD1076]
MVDDERRRAAEQRRRKLARRLAWKLAHPDSDAPHGALSHSGSATAKQALRLIARGDATITGVETVERIADGLHIPGGMLGLAARCWENTTATGTQPAREDESMHRRQLLRGALGTGLTGTAFKSVADILYDVDRPLASTAGAADLVHRQTVAEQHSYGYAGRAPAEALADLIADFADITPLLRRPQPTNTRVELSRIMAQLGGMTAIVLHDLGDRREAVTWFTTAGRAANESGDRALHAWILARHAMVPLNFGAPNAAAQLAEQARRTAGTAPTAAATLAAAVAAVAARAHALAGRRHDATGALHVADSLAESLPTGERADTWFGHPDQKHHVHLSHALTALGDTTRARHSQARALALSAPTSTLTRTLLRLDAATCQHHDGDTLQACEAATRALTDIPAAFRTGLVRSRANDLCAPSPRPCAPHRPHETSPTRSPRSNPPLGTRCALPDRRGFRDLKSQLLLRPVFHRLEHRIRAHVLICWLALLLIRVAERTTGQTWRNTNRQLGRISQVTLAGPAGTVVQTTPLRPEHKAIYQALSVQPPARVTAFDPR